MSEEIADAPPKRERRTFIKWSWSLAMVTALVAAYGTLAAFMARFLYPARPTTRGWQMVIDLPSIQPSESIIYRLPNGSPVNITRVGDTGSADDFLALSSTCPHLGCQVHWEPQNNRFFCPCHNGVFNPEGVAIGGPPGDAGQSLPKYPLKVEHNLLFIEVPLDQVALGPGNVEQPAAPTGPGHDPCLQSISNKGRVA
jgi:Rieske Fe-S protein